uniref:Uncharacterized protein n=1 Tax=Anguilla anguilla TaxID=7936 RepID=A0A0E9XWB0_ANGAN
MVLKESVFIWFQTLKNNSKNYNIYTIYINTFITYTSNST